MLMTERYDGLNAPGTRDGEVPVYVGGKLKDIYRELPQDFEGGEKTGLTDEGYVVYRNRSTGMLVFWKLRYTAYDDMWTPAGGHGYPDANANPATIPAGKGSSYLITPERGVVRNSRGGGG